MTTLPKHPPLWLQRGSLPLNPRIVGYEKAGEGRCDWCGTEPRTLSVGPGGHKLCTNCIFELTEGPPPLMCVRCLRLETQWRLRRDRWGDLRCDSCWIT